MNRLNVRSIAALAVLLSCSATRSFAAETPATAKEVPAATAATPPRYVRHMNHWWYRTADHKWMYYINGKWARYQTPLLGAAPRAPANGAAGLGDSNTGIGSVAGIGGYAAGSNSLTSSTSDNPRPGPTTIYVPVGGRFNLPINGAYPGTMYPAW
jgi:hypothetical protein